MEERNKTKKICAVAICNSPRNKDIIYHVFPKDEVISKQWIVKCKRQDKINTKFASICSSHFLPSDYERDLKNELLGLPLKKTLKPDAIPSQNLVVEKTVPTETQKTQQQVNHFKI